MRFLSLFAGIGGFDLGLERAGMECAGQVENEGFCLEILEKHWPDVKRIADIRDVKGDKFGAVDLICGGFPCQPFSVAGKRLGTKDNRDLWPEMFRVITAIRPAWVLAENTPGFGTMDILGNPFEVESRTGGRNANGVDYTSVGIRQEKMYLVHASEALRSVGYKVAVLSLPACAVDAPHRRERLFIVAYAAGTRQGEGRSGAGRAVRDGARGAEPERRGGVVVHSPSQGRDTTGRTSEAVSRSGAEQQPARRNSGGFWFDAERINGRRVKPGICLLAPGVSRRVAKLRALGNSVIPELVEIIGRSIILADDYPHDPRD